MSTARSIKQAQAVLENACVYDSFGDLQSSMEWLEQDTDLHELRSRIGVAISEAEALLEGLNEAKQKIGAE